MELESWTDADCAAVLDLLVEAGGDDAPKPEEETKKLSASERRARHREVVRRSYHRNKEHMNGLRNRMKELETRLDALRNGKGHDIEVQKLQQQYSQLQIETTELQFESEQLRGNLASQQNFVNTVHLYASQAYEDDNNELSEDENQDDRWSEVSFPSTSGDDSSPDQKETRRFYSEPQPTYISETYPYVATSAEARSEIGFKSLSLGSSRDVVHTSYQEILRFSLSRATMSTGAQVLGWHDKRLVEGTKVNFSMSKQFPGLHAADLMLNTFKCMSDPLCADSKFRGMLKLRVLQRVNDDTIVALRDTTSPDGSKLFRTVYLLFRVRTRKGFILCTRSLHDSSVVDKEKTKWTRDGREIQWVDFFTWFLFEGIQNPMGNMFLEHEATTQVEYCGHMDYGDKEQIPTLLMQALSVAMMWQAMIVGPLFSLPSSS